MITIWLPSHNHGSRKWVPPILVSFYVRKDYDYTHIPYIPGTEMTLVLIGKRPCFGGLTFKNRDHLGSRYLDIYLSFACLFDFRVDPNAWKLLMSLHRSAICVSLTSHACWHRIGGRRETGLLQSRTILRYTPEIQHGTWKWWFPIGISFSKGDKFRFHVCFGGCILSMGLEPNTTLGKGFQGFLG